MTAKHWIISGSVLAALLCLNGYMQSIQDKADADYRASLRNQKAANTQALAKLEKDAGKLLSLDKITTSK